MENRNGLIGNYLRRGRLRFDSIGCGLHRGRYYFGTTFFDEKGGEFDAVVTSNREVYVNWAPIIENEKNEIKTKK